MSRKFETALDDCLALQRAGASIEDCLARYPEFAGDLLPLLSLASAVRDVPTPRPDTATVEAHRRQMLEAVQNAAPLNYRRSPATLSWLWRLPGFLRNGSWLRTAVTLAAVLLLVGLASGSLFLSTADSLPGQALYPLKRFGESVRLSLTLERAERQQLLTDYRLERQCEVREVLDVGQQADLEFRGELQEIGDSYWIIGGLNVTLHEGTLVEGQPMVGAMVIVRAHSPGNGTLLATKLQALADPILLTPMATATQVTAPSATPTASATPVTTATITPTTTATPSSTLTRAATLSPAPTETSTPTSTPTEKSTPTSTPTMTASPEPTTTPTPGETDQWEPTDHPDEDETDEPEPTDDGD